MTIFFDRQAPRGPDMQGQCDWHENQARIDAVVREARLRTLSVIRKEGDTIGVGAVVLCDPELPEWYSIQPTTVIR